MKKTQKPENFTPECWDDGTYRTGSTRPPKGSSPLLAVSLCSVIFLGGIASSLGLTTLLIRALESSIEPTLPLTMQTSPTNPADPADLDGNEPELPADALQELPLKERVVDDASAKEAYDLGSRSIVDIAVYRNDETGLDTIGVVLSENGYILTNASALEDAQRIYITLSDGSVNRAALVGSDPMTDLAVVYVPANGLEAAEFADAKDLAVGDPVIFLGEDCQGEGIISNIRSNVLSGGKKLELLQTSATDNTCGGVVLTPGGQVVGVLCPRFVDFLGSDSNCAGYALPSNSVKAIVDQLLQTGYVSGRPDLGVTAEEVTGVYQDFWCIPNGLLITASDADGDLCAGDILLSVNGTAVNSLSDLHQALFSKSVGQEVTAVVYRGGKRICVDVTLREFFPDRAGR